MNTIMRVIIVSVTVAFVLFNFLLHKKRRKKKVPGIKTSKMKWRYKLMMKSDP